MPARQWKRRRSRSPLGQPNCPSGGAGGNRCGREKASGIHGSQGVVITTQFEGTATVSGKLKTAAIAGACPKPGPGPDRPLILCKEADRYTARVGDVITFTLKYSNSGAQPMTDVVVTDSLTGRLEYVPAAPKPTGTRSSLPKRTKRGHSFCAGRSTAALARSRRPDHFPGESAKERS